MAEFRMMELFEFSLLLKGSSRSKENVEKRFSWMSFLRREFDAVERLQRLGVVSIGNQGLGARVCLKKKCV